MTDPNETPDPQPPIVPSESSDSTEESQTIMHQMLAMFSGDPMAGKMTAEHLTQAINNSHVIDQEEIKFRRSNRWFHLAFAGLGAGYGLGRRRSAED